MEVRCSNCATEYEFDDALVSARGTSVKCTQCGHQFRVHARGASTAPEQWLVRDSAGKDRVFNSLRELQQAIVKGQLHPLDQLSRGGQAFRPLEDIYELQTFFTAASSGGRRPAPSTLLGVGQYRNSASGAPRPSPPQRRVEDEPVSHDRVTPVNAVQPPPVAERASFFPPESVPAAPVSGRGDASGAWPGMQAPVSPERDAAPAPGPIPWQNLEGLRSESDPAEPGTPARSRWILLLVVIGALGLVFFTVGRNYFSKYTAPEAARPVLDERVPLLVQEGRALLDRGEFEDARAEFAKASVLAENEPQVVAAIAELELARADLLWLHREIRRAIASVKPADKKEALTGGGGSGAAAASSSVSAPMGDRESEFQRRLGEQLVKAKEATQRAQTLAPEDLAVIRDRVDLLRLQGDLKQARELVARLSERASEAQNAYSLGVLDYAEGEAGYTSAIARLKVAARNESALGRARAALILALAKTDAAPAASAELDKLKLIAPNHALLSDLGLLVEKAQPATAPTPAASAAPTAAPAAAREPAAAAREPAPARERAPARASSDPKVLIERAGKLYRQGELAEAEELYQSALRQEPDNVPALYALGDIARQRGANATATAFYDRVLEHDPNHLQALMARADMQWHAGQKAGAVQMYRRVLARVGSTHAYGVRALSRIEEFERGSAPARPAESGGSAPASAEDNTESESPSDGKPKPEPEPSAEPDNEAPAAPAGNQAGSSS